MATRKKTSTAKKTSTVKAKRVVKPKPTGDTFVIASSYCGKLNQISYEREVIGEGNLEEAMKRLVIQEKKNDNLSDTYFVLKVIGKYTKPTTFEYEHVSLESKDK